MTRDIEVPDAVFAPLRARYDDAQLVELAATVGAYNMVSRFLVALRVGH
jgi:alkylhydroperoxidase family enzyme